MSQPTTGHPEQATPGATPERPLLLGEYNLAGGTTSVISSAGNGLEGSTAAGRQAGVYGSDESTRGGYGVYGSSEHGTGVTGNASADGEYGVAGNATGDGGAGVSGHDGSPGGGSGVYGVSVHGAGVAGTSLDGTGVAGAGTSAGQAGVYGFGSGGAAGVHAEAAGGPALAVDGPVRFASCGVAVVTGTGARPLSSVRVAGVALSPASLVLATIQGVLTGVGVAGVVPDLPARAFSIHLTAPAVTSVTIGWFVIEAGHAAISLPPR